MSSFTIAKQLCPVCHQTIVAIPYREIDDTLQTTPSQCSECRSFISIEKQPNGSLTVVPSKGTPSNYPDDAIKTCPNEKCNNPLRAWRHPSKAIAILHGAHQLSSSRFQCDKCHQEFEVK